MEELIERLWSIEAEAQKNLPTPLPYVYAEAAAALEAQAAKIIALEARLIEEDHANAMGADELLLDIAELRAKLADDAKCTHKWVMDQEAVRHYCCQKCGAVSNSAAMAKEGNNG